MAFVYCCFVYKPDSWYNNLDNQTPQIEQKGVSGMTQRFTIERPQNQQNFKAGFDPWRRNDAPKNEPCKTAMLSSRCTHCNSELTSDEIKELICPVCGNLRKISC